MKARKILFWLNIIAVLLLLLTYYSAIAKPCKITLLTMFPYFYIVMLIVNACFVILWLLLKWPFASMSLIAILLGMRFMTAVFPVQACFNDDDDDDAKCDIRLMSYNAMVFGLYGWKNNDSVKAAMLHVIAGESPDVLCVQEAFWQTGATNFVTIDSLQILLDAPYVHLAPLAVQVQRQHFGLATISRFPVVGTFVHHFKKSFNGFAYTDVLVGNDTIRIFNCHLQSLQLDDNDYTALRQHEELGHDTKVILRKYLAAARKRASQVDFVRHCLDTCPHPVFVCGDFNDGPLSYTYSQLAANLNDAYSHAGTFPGYTWENFDLKQRIDYILYSDDFRCVGYNVLRKKLSDHFPVTGNFNFK